MSFRPLEARLSDAGAYTRAYVLGTDGTNVYIQVGGKTLYFAVL
jgi:hypothetical protein